MLEMMTADVEAETRTMQLARAVNAKFGVSITTAIGDIKLARVKLAEAMNDATPWLGRRSGHAVAPRPQRPKRPASSVSPPTRCSASASSSVCTKRPTRPWPRRSRPRSCRPNSTPRSAPSSRRWRPTRSRRCSRARGFVIAASTSTPRWHRPPSLAASASGSATPCRPTCPTSPTRGASRGAWPTAATRCGAATTGACSTTWCAAGC